MDMELKVEVKSGKDLSQSAIDAINKAKARESMPDVKEDDLENSTFILLKDSNDNILAQGQLVSIDGINFNNELFSILGIGGIIANPKRKGYGRKLMLVIKDYLSKNKTTGVGFTGVPEFYRKCGYSTDRDSLKRFVHIVDNREIRNTEDEYVVFIDSDDRFMEKVLRNPKQKVYLPRDPNW